MEAVMKAKVDAETKTNEQAKYVKPTTEKHEPVKIIQGSDDCTGLYYTSLYYY